MSINQNIPRYELLRSKRKTLVVYIHAGTVEVRAPRQMSVSVIEDFLISKQSWINKKLEQSCAQQLQRDLFKLSYGDQLLYRGKYYPIAVSKNDRSSFEGYHFLLPANLDSDEMKHACVLIYKKLALDYLTKRSLFMAAQMGVEPESIKISNAKKQWGSCNSKAVIRFSWRLIMAKDAVIDYLIVHELAHLQQMNHSPQFWDIVRQQLPDYKARQKQLRCLQNLLAAQDW